MDHALKVSGAVLLLYHHEHRAELDATDLAGSLPLGLMHDRNLNPRDFSPVRLCLSGGDKVPVQLRRDFEASVAFAIDECLA